jgi:hypothetical protein
MADPSAKDRTFREWFPPTRAFNECKGASKPPGPLQLRAGGLANIDVSMLFGPAKAKPSGILSHAASTHAPFQLRFPGLKGSGLLRRIFMREDQHFERVATPWERKYSPTFGTHPTVPDIYSGSAATGVQVAMPVMDERGTVKGYLLTKSEDDGHVVILANIDGIELAAEFKPHNLDTDEIGNLVLFLIASGGLALIRRGVLLLLESGGEATAEMVSQTASTSATARSMVRALRVEGQEVVVNVGGEGSAAEASQWPRAINLNPIKAGRPTVIPNLVKAEGEEIGELFESNSVDKIVSSKLPPSVNAERLAKGVAQTLKKGGRLEINIFGGGVKEWATTFSETLVKNGFDAKNIKIISDVLIQAVK